MGVFPAAIDLAETASPFRRNYPPSQEPASERSGRALFLRRPEIAAAHGPAQPACASPARGRRRSADASGGPIAQAIVAEVNDDGIQHMSAMDLLDYRARERDTLCQPYRAYAVCSMGPPTSGGIALLQILGILQNFDLAPLDPDGARPSTWSPIQPPRLADRDRFRRCRFRARADRQLLDRLPEGARRADPRRRSSARRGRASSPTMIVAQASPAIELIHHAFRDRGQRRRHRRMTNIGWVGSHRMVGGFLLNNELTDFSFSRPRAAAGYQPHRARQAPARS
jgi:gamma-glutamyltranspeptidase/glutathione hydrolase